MGFIGVNISKTNSFGKQVASNDGVGLLIIGGATATGNLALKVAKGLLSLKDAEALGIDPGYDDTNNILAYHHIDEFFRVSPNGKLYVVLDDGTLTKEEIKAIVKANQDIKFIGEVRNSATAPADFATYVSAWQDMVNELAAESRLIDAVLIEGKEFDANTLISAYQDLRALNAPNVSVVIAQDPIIRNIKTQYETYAAIGTAMGAISVRKVNENIGSVDIENKPDLYKGNQNYPLTDIARSRWLSAVLQSGKDVTELTDNEINALNRKGYIFAGFYNGYAGFYFNDSHTAVTAASDYARIENNRVWNKAARIIRLTLLPKVKGNILKDPQTGYIDPAAAKSLEKLAEGKLAQMVADKEVSGVGVYIDPEQTLSDGIPLVVKAKVVHNDIIHEFDVQLGLTEKL